MAQPFHTVGARVQGAFLGTPITGVVTSYRTTHDRDRIEITVRFDEPTMILYRLRDEITLTVAADGSDPDGTGNYLGPVQHPDTFWLRRDADNAVHLVAPTDGCDQCSGLGCPFCTEPHTLCQTGTEAMVHADTITPTNACLNCVGDAITQYDLSSDQLWAIVGGR